MGRGVVRSGGLRIRPFWASCALAILLALGVMAYAALWAPWEVCPYPILYAPSDHSVSGVCEQRFAWIFDPPLNPDWQLEKGAYFLRCAVGAVVAAAIAGTPLWWRKRRRSSA